MTSGTPVQAARTATRDVAPEQRSVLLVFVGLIVTMLVAVVDMVKAQTSDLQKLVKDMTKAATAAMRITTDPIRFTMPKLPLFPQVHDPDRAQDLVRHASRRLWSRPGHLARP